MVRPASRFGIGRFSRDTLNRRKHCARALAENRWTSEPTSHATAPVGDGEQSIYATENVVVGTDRRAVRLLRVIGAPGGRALSIYETLFDHGRQPWHRSGHCRGTERIRCGLAFAWPRYRCAGRGLRARENTMRAGLPAYP